MLTKLFTKIKQKDLCTIIPLINFQAKETKPAVKKKNYIFLNHINKYSKRRLEDKIELNKQTNKISVKKKNNTKNISIKIKKKERNFMSSYSK